MLAAQGCHGGQESIDPQHLFSQHLSKVTIFAPLLYPLWVSAFGCSYSAIHG